MNTANPRADQARTATSSATRISLRAKALTALVQIALIALITLGLLEALVAFSFRYPAASPVPATLLRYLHLRFDRNVIQVLPECAMYDETLTYRLRPGRCTFASREFRNEYRINTLGVRDDEESLRAPQTVVLGDSLAMGWGVNQDESFSSVYERTTGVRTLNAGVSSYGTVRELRMLERIDRSAMKDLVVQYNQNDAFENSQLVERPPFQTLTREHYERTVADQRDLLRYYPGKYAFNVLVQLQSMVRGRQPVQESSNIDLDRQAWLFIEVLRRSKVDLRQYRLTVLAVDSDFIAAAKRAAQQSEIDWISRIGFVDAAPITKVQGALYRLDDHPTAVGHQEIARLLVAHLAGTN